MNKPKSDHQFKSSWRWPESFESWVESLIDGFTVNVCAGLSPLGDVRIDLMSPPEIISSLSDAKNTSLSDARNVCSDLLEQQFVDHDVVKELYESSATTPPGLTSQIDTNGFLRADVFGGNRLPIGDDTADWVICDPPWKSLSTSSRRNLFGELTRITAPGGHILFNAWWVPTSDNTTLDQIRLRRDDERNGAGTPNISYASIHTVYPSPHTARYLSQTFTDREFTPEPESLKETIEAETAYRLEHIGGIDHTAYDIRSVGPDTSRRCPHCGSTKLLPATDNTKLDASGCERIYQCPSCEYPVPERELDAIAAGHIQQIRYEHGWSDIPPHELRGISPEDPAVEVVDRLEAEPGIGDGEGEAYLKSALGVELDTDQEFPSGSTEEVPG